MRATSSSASVGSSNEWRSLFLPLAEKERVIFASFFSPLVPVDSEHADGFSGLNAFHVMNDIDTRHRALLCVTEAQSVLIFDLCSDAQGPRRVAAFAAVTAAGTSPTSYGSRRSDATEELVTNSSQLHLPTLPSATNKPSNAVPAVTATSASLVPMALLHASRLSVSTTEGAAASHASVLPLRGVMGSSNGRVDVFTERNFVFGFFAHDCPVVQVDTLFVGDSALPPPVPEGHAAPTAASPSNASDMIGFLSMGSDGVVFVWRRRMEGFRREKLLEPSAFSKCHAIHVTLPLRAMPIGSILPQSNTDIGVDSGSLQHTSSGARYSPASPATRITPPPIQAFHSSSEPLSCGFLKMSPSLILSGGNGFSNCVRVRSCESMKEVEEAVELGGVLTRTTAITADGCICLVARERVVHSVDYLTRTCKRIVTAPSTVTALSLQYPVAAAGCTDGSLLLFNVISGNVIGRQSTYNGSPVLSLSFVLSATLLAVTDTLTNSVEIFEAPEACLRQAALSHSTRKSETQQALQYFASADVVEHHVALEECSTGAGSAAQVRIAAASEQLLLSRYLVPEECSLYLSRQHKVL